MDPEFNKKIHLNRNSDMKHWQQYSEKEKLQLLDITSAAKALPRLAVEKDWWVMAVMNGYIEKPVGQSEKDSPSLCHQRTASRVDYNIDRDRDKRFYCYTGNYKRA